MAEGVNVGVAYLEVAASARGAAQQIAKDLDAPTRSAGDKAGKNIGGGILKGARAVAGPIAALFAADKIVDFLKDANAEARESQKVGARTANVIKSTGGAAKISADQIGQLSTSISNKSGVDDEAVQSGANLLLTFTNIRNEAGKGNDVFSQTTKLSTDMAAALGKSVPGAAKVLGKALNDPTKGLAGLSRVGVTFTDDQKKQVKALQASGKTLDAQKIILKAVQDRFGGAAAATATNGEKLKVAFDNFKEQIGTALLPIIDKVAGILTDKVIPAVSGFFQQMQNGTGKGGQFVAILKTVAGALQSVAGFLYQNRDVLIPLVGIITGVIGAIKVFTAVQTILNLVLSANPIGLIVIGIAALVAGLIIAYKKSATFRAIVQGALGAVKAVAIAVVNFFTTKFVPFFTKKIPGAFQTVVSWVKSHWPILLSILGGPIGLAVALIIKHRDAIYTGLQAAVTWVKTTFKVGWQVLKDILLSPVRLAREGFDRILGPGGVVRTAFRNAVTAIGGIWNGLKEKAKAPISFVINTVLNDGLIGAFNKVAGFLPGVKSLPRISVPGFHDGGFTPMVDKRQVAGVVHGQEYVAPAWMNPIFPQLEAMRRQGKSSMKGYFDGGFVGGSGRFTDLFASRLLMASKLAGTIFNVFQRGFRPATSYSGTSHQGDAVDLGPINSRVVSALRSVGIAAWDRTGKGNWAPHIHGVPLPGSGSAAGSAVWQAQDYLRGGDGLGGRDNGPRVSVIGKIGEFIKAGFSSVADWFKNLVKDPLAKLNGLNSTPFGSLAAGVPRLVFEGMQSQVKGFAGGGTVTPGWSVVGERGRELMYSPNGGQKVFSNRDSGQMLRGGPTVQGNTFYGFTPADLIEEIDKKQRREDALHPVWA